MNKLFLALLAVVAMAGLVFADATYTTTNNAKGGNADYGFGAVVDQTNGYTQHVDSKGAASTQEKAQTLVECIDTNDMYSGCSVLSGAGRLTTITYGGPNAAAGDYMLVYDNTSASGTPKYDISVGTAKNTVTINIPGGAIMSTGIFAKAGTTASTASVATFTYDN